MPQQSTQHVGRYLRSSKRLACRWKRERADVQSSIGRNRVCRRHIGLTLPALVSQAQRYLWRVWSPCGLRPMGTAVGKCAERINSDFLFGTALVSRSISAFKQGTLFERIFGKVNIEGRTLVG